MTVKAVSTLGANPISLVRKLAALSGLTVLKETKVTVDSADYYNDVVAKINDNLYIEIYDALYAEMNSDATKIPTIYKSSTQHDVMFIPKQEVELTDLSRRTVSTAYTNEILSSAITSTTFEYQQKLSLSFMITLATSRTTKSDGGGLWSVSNLYYKAPKVVLPEDLGNISIIGNDYGYLESIYSGTAPTAPFKRGILNTGFRAIPTKCYAPGQGANVLVYSRSASGESQPSLVCVTGAEIRIATAVDISNNLVNPTDWEACPLFTDAVCDTEYLAFFVQNAKGQNMLITSVDTSKGNSLAGNFPAIYKNIPIAYNPSADIETKCTMLGDSNSASTKKVMTPFIPEPPISSDSILGGPVVSNVYAFDSNEIRGTLPNILGCDKNLNMGTIGWLNGVKYKVIYPKIMLKI